jgi:hypothetical protein
VNGIGDIPVAMYVHSCNRQEPGSVGEASASRVGDTVRFERYKLDFRVYHFKL